MESYSRENVTIVTSTATERQTVGGKEIKTKIEIKIRLQEIPASMGNAINVKNRPQGCLLLDKERKIELKRSRQPLHGSHIMWRSSIIEQ